MNEEMERHGRKMYAIACNVTKKREREIAEAERRRLEREIEKLKYRAREPYRGRKEWRWKREILSVQTVIVIALSVIVLKVIEILPMIELRQ